MERIKKNLFSEVFGNAFSALKILFEGFEKNETQLNKEEEEELDKLVKQSKGIRTLEESLQSQSESGKKTIQKNIEVNVKAEKYKKVEAKKAEKTVDAKERD